MLLYSSFSRRPAIEISILFLFFFSSQQRQYEQNSEFKDTMTQKQRFLFVYDVCTAARMVYEASSKLLDLLLLSKLVNSSMFDS